MNLFGPLKPGEASKIIKGIEKCTPLLKAWDRVPLVSGRGGTLPGCSSL